MPLKNATITKSNYLIANVNQVLENDWFFSVSQGGLQDVFAALFRRSLFIPDP